ncbi:type I-B CRISPR-associated protein Cas5b [Thermovibrio sp.]
MVYRLVVFDIWGELAHFRRFFTTSSPLTFSFPPPTTVRGIVGAILGLPKDKYIEITNKLKVGISLLSPVKKIRLGLNIIFTKGSGGKFEPTLFKDKKGDKNKTLRTRIQAEFLKDVKYRVYLAGDEELLNSLLKYLPYHKTEYTVSLGLSECLADFKFVGEYKAELLKEANSVKSVIPTECIKSLDFESPVKIAKERIPVFMNSDRVVLKYENVAFETSGKEIKGSFENVYHVRELRENVYLFTVPSQQVLERPFNRR